jgi:hypothetical protein
MIVATTAGAAARLPVNSTAVPRTVVSVNGATSLAYAGVPIDATNPATLLSTDRAGCLWWTSGSALALPAISGVFAANFPACIHNISGGTLTITPNAGASDLIDGLASEPVLNNFTVFLRQDSTSAPGHWFTDIVPLFQAFGNNCPTALNWSTTAGIGCTTQLPIANVGSSGLSGTGPITISAAGAIGCATCLTSAPVTSVNALTGAVVIEAATAGQVAISGGNAAALTGAADLTYATHTFSGISTTIFDLSPATGTAAFKVPSTTTNTASAAAVIDFDTTNNNYHGWTGGADSFFTAEDSAIGVGKIPKAASATNGLLSASSMTDNATSVTSTDPGGFISAPTSVAGNFSMKQGTVASTTTTAITHAGPTAVTSYVVTEPGTAAQGMATGTLSGSVITQGFSGDANHSATVTIGSGTSISSTSLCSTTICPAGTYRVNVYLDITTACGTSGTYIVNLIYTDDQGLKTIPVNINGTGSVPATGTLTTTSTSNYGENAQVIRSTGATSINYSTTAVACGTSGPMVGKLYMAVEAIQ